MPLCGHDSDGAIRNTLFRVSRNDCSASDHKITKSRMKSISVNQHKLVSTVQLASLSLFADQQIKQIAMAEEEGTLVAGGKHVVSPGVAVEELEAGKEKQLFETCPVEVAKMLASKDALQIYDKFVSAIKHNMKTRSFFGNWKGAEIEIILDEYRDEFANAGVKVALCKRKSSGGSFRWYVVSCDRNHSAWSAFVSRISVFL